MPNDPILRSEFLKPLSREHHHGLLLCWKIRTGLRKGVSARRIKAFADWFFEGHLKKHFEVEEDKVFPLLGLNHPMVEKALKDHRRLRRLFAEKEQIDKSLGLLE